MKAAIHNPDVSEDAKESAAQRLEHMSEGGQNGEVPTNRVLAGYKATLSSKQNLPHLVILASLLKLILIFIFILSDQNTSEEAKAHAREVLEAAGYTVERTADIPEDEHEKRVIAGYKAALHSKYL